MMVRMGLVTTEIILAFACVIVFCISLANMTTISYISYKGDSRDRMTVNKKYIAIVLFMSVALITLMIRNLK